jgi:NACalpha-BTF3-like transcription factor
LASLPAGDGRARLETAVELLRREWRDGCRAGIAYRTTLGSVRRLRQIAASEQIAGDLARLIADLEAFPPGGNFDFDSFGFAAAATAMPERHQSIDAQLRLLAPGKVSEDDKLVEYDALLVDRFLDILQDLHGPHLREFVSPDHINTRPPPQIRMYRRSRADQLTSLSLSSRAQVQECYELSAEYENDRDEARLGELGSKLTSLPPGDSIVVASSFSHMLNLANLAEEVQVAQRRRIKLKRGDFADEASAPTESDIEETLKRLVSQLGKSREEVFDALKNQTVDLVFTAHPTQSVRRSLLQKHGRWVRTIVVVALLWLIWLMPFCSPLGSCVWKQMLNALLVLIWFCCSGSVTA